MEFETDKISSYYHKSAKPSFFFYRTSLIISMLVLLGGLGLNLYTINQNTPLQTQSKAANPASEKIPLPSLPQGCIYEKTSQGYVVVCHTPTPVLQMNPTGAMPSLPPQCKYEASASGTIVTCTGSNGQTFTIPLPGR